MELKQIKDLMNALGRSDINSLHLKDGDFELRLERSTHETFVPAQKVEVSPQQVAFTHAHIGTLPASSAPPKGNLEVKEPAESKKSDTDKGSYITSPMVGTFYTSPTPESPSFVKVGDIIEKGTVVCIVEAMKVMNEVKADKSGRLLEVMVENASPVEFGSKLFRIEG